MVRALLYHYYKSILIREIPFFNLTLKFKISNYGEKEYRKVS